MHIALTPSRSAARGAPRVLRRPRHPRASRAGAGLGDSGEFGDARRLQGRDPPDRPDGWLGIGWPEEYGGQDRSMIDQLIFTDVAAVAGVPIPYLTLNTVGPTIMRFGTDEQKDDFLPKILEGELHFSIGYSEPGSGTDLACLKTRARARGRRVGDQRPEDVDLPDPVRRLDLAGLPHRPRPAPAQGPLDDPGARRLPRASPTRRCTPSPACGTSATYYEDVRVPVGQPGRRAQRRLVADDQPAQPRARRPHLRRAAHPLARRWSATWAQQTKNPDGAAGHRPRVGAGRCSAGRTPAPRCSSCSTGSSPSADRGPLPRRCVAPPRSTARSWPPRSTAR